MGTSTDLLNEMYVNALEDTGSQRGAWKQLGLEPAEGRRVHRRCSELIKERADDALNALMLTAVTTLGDALTEDGSTPKGDLRIKGATEILDRAGITKQIRKEELEAMQGATWVLPAKVEITTAD